MPHRKVRKGPLRIPEGYSEGMKPSDIDARVYFLLPIVLGIGRGIVVDYYDFLTLLLSVMLGSLGFFFVLGGMASTIKGENESWGMLIVFYFTPLLVMTFFP